MEISELILPAKGIRGTIILPGDKSISHRAVMTSAMAHGSTKITNFSASADCWATVRCVRELGVNIADENGGLVVNGVGKNGLSAPKKQLECDNSGTTMRLLSGVLAGQHFISELSGDESLQERPMKRIITPLSEMGCEIESRGYRAPLRILGRNPLTAIQYRPDVASAQVKSAVLLAGLNADGITSVFEPVQTRDHTERMLRWFGVEVVESIESGGEKKISVAGDARLTAKDIEVPADISSAAFFLVAAGLLPGSELHLERVGINGTRRAIIDVLCRLGLQIEIENEREICNEPVADIFVRGASSSTLIGRESARLSGDVIANLIDEIPILAIAGTQIQGGIEVRDAAELRHKESDRIAALVSNLKRMNADVEEYDDGFRVGKSRLKGVEVDSFGDHRIAMAFAIAGLFADGETRIAGAGCARVSFPSFFETLKDLRY